MGHLQTEWDLTARDPHIVGRGSVLFPAPFPYPIAGRWATVLTVQRDSATMTVLARRHAASCGSQGPRRSVGRRGYEQFEVKLDG